jgi:hypothetical protein
LVNSLLLLAGLLQAAGTAAPVVSHAGLDAGAAVVADVPLMSLKGWFGASRGPLEAGLQAPIRFDIAGGSLRERDWDEISDLGRLVRFLRYTPWIEIGELNEATLGNGTIVRRYHNNIDDDHRRTAARLRINVDKFEVDGFIDHLLDDPIIAGRAGLVLGEFGVGGTFATDTGAPIFVDGTADGAGNLKGDTDLRAMYGIDFRWTASDTPTFKGTVYGDFNALQNGNPGAHGGLLMQFPTKDGLWMAVRLEGMWFGDRYDWAVFDMGYLIDRWSLKWARIEEYPSSFGGRFGFSLDYQQALVLGAEYANTTDLDRSDFSLWLRIPHKNVRLSGIWRRRFADPDALPVDVEQAMAAGSVGIKLGPFGWLDGTVARMYRTTEYSTGNSVYEPFNEASIILQMLFF